MNQRFTYPSRTRGTLVACVFFAGLCIATVVIWQFTDWLGKGDANRGFGFGLCALSFAAASLNRATEWLSPIVRECWVNDGVFGWHSPRGPYASGEVALADVIVLRLQLQDHFQLLTAHDRHNVPLKCVQDIHAIADLITKAAPHIRVEWTVATVGDR